MNVMFCKEYEIEVLEHFTYAQLDYFSKTLAKAIVDLEKLKTMAVMCQKDTKAVEYQRYVHNARTNRETMLVVMMAKEGDTCEHTEIETVWLN